MTQPKSTRKNILDVPPIERWLINLGLENLKTNFPVNSTTRKKVVLLIEKLGEGTDEQ